MTELIEGVEVRLLTLSRPWPRMFDPDVGKDVENRTKPLRKLPLWLALHAGKGWDAGAALGLRAGSFGLSAMVAMDRAPKPEDHPHSVITHLAYCSACNRPPHVRSGGGGFRWAFGPYCWQTPRVVKLPEPVPCKGGQGLRKLPPEVFVGVLAQYEALKAGVCPCSSPNLRYRKCLKCGGQWIGDCDDGDEVIW